jgi:PST family polysaccharide transporter
VIANYFFILSDKLLRMACGLVTNILLVAYLTPVELGTWNYVLSLAAIAGAISIFSGLDVIVIRDLAQAEPSERGRIIGSVGVLRFLAGAMATIGSIAFVAWVEEWQLAQLIFIIALSYFTQVFHTLDYFFQSQLIPKYSAFVLNVTTGVGFVAKVGLMYWNLLDLDTLCWILVLESCLIGSGYVWLVKFHFPDVAPRHWRVDAARVRLYAGAGLALLGSGLVSVIIARVSIFQIDSHFDRASVAVFGLYVLVFEAVLMVNYALANTYYPRIIVQHSEPAAYAQSLYALLRRQTVLWLGLVSSIEVVVLAGRNLFAAFIDPIYRQSLTMIQLGLPVTALFVVNFLLLQFVIIPLGNERHQLARAIMGLAVLLAANTVFFRTGQLILVVGSIALSQLSMLAFTIAIFHKEIRNTWSAREW